MRLKRLYIYVLLLFLLANFVLPISNCFATSDEVVVDAPCAILMESNTGKILYEKNAYEKMYPASTTKIMTAILAIENRELSSIAKVSENAISTVPSGYSTASLQLDEELDFEQLLHVLLIPSANDAANVIAEDIGGSIEGFSSMMNSKAAELGCKNTNFVNPNGVHDENHYSTAYDLAIIGRYAMQNEIFRNIVSTVKYTLPATNKYNKTDRTFTTTNNLLNDKNNNYYKYAIGTKTGYTIPAKNCIVATANKNDMELICVILGANNTAEANKFKDCKSLFEYGYNNYTYTSLHKKDNVYQVVTPFNASGKIKELDILFENDLNILVKKSDLDVNFIPDVNLSKIKAPVSKGDIVGSISYSVYDINYTTNLIAGQDIEANSIFSIILKTVLIVITLIIFKHFLSSLNKKGKKKKSKKRKTSRYYL